MPPRRAARTMDRARRPRLQVLAQIRQGRPFRAKLQWMRQDRSLSPPHPALQRVEAHPVDQLGGPLDLPYGEIAIFACLERTSFTENTQRPRAFARHAGEAF